MSFSKRKQIKHILILFLTLSSLSCVTSSLDKKTTFNIEDSNYIELVKRIEFDLEVQNRIPDEKMDFHIRQIERLNEKSLIVGIVMSNNNPNPSSDICKYIAYEDKHIYIYNDESCRPDDREKLVSKGLLNKEGNDVFSTYDANYWKVLVVKKEEDFFYYNMITLSKELKGESIENDF